MIICTNCGNHNENDDEFCGSCGKFLEWVGEKVEAPAAPVPAPEPEPEVSAKVGLVDRVKAAVGIDEHDRATEGAEDATPSPGGAAGGPTEEEIAIAAAMASQQAHLEAEAAEAARRAMQAEVEARERVEAQRKADEEAAAARRAEGEARAAAAAEAAAARRAEEEARRRAEDEARATSEADRRREAEAEAARRAEAEAAAVAAAEASAAAAQEAARLAREAAEREALDAAQQAEAEAEAARQTAEAEEAAAALAAARRAEEEARASAEVEARARVEAEAREHAEIEARRRAEDEARRRGEEEARTKAEAEARAREQEEARLRAEDETRARIAAQARAKEEEEARRRAAALLTRPKAVIPTPAEDEPAGGTKAERAVAITPTAAAQRPVAQQPSAVKAPPRPDPKAKPPEVALKAGDLVCDQCGQGNDPTRKFCRKCGNSLAKAAPVKKLPWWKTLFSSKKKKGKTSKEAKGGKSARNKANEAKYKAQRLRAKVRFIFIGIAMLSIIGVNLALPDLRSNVVVKVKGGFTSIQGIFNPQFKTVNAVEVTATSSVPGHEPGFANDLVLNSFWAEAAEGEGIGQTISFTFESPADLTKVLISAGSTDTPENYLNQPRPKDLHLVFDTGGSFDLTLEDEFRKSQSFTIKGAEGVTKVDVVISSVYRGRNGLDTAIAEVEFKKKG